MKDLLLSLVVIVFSGAAGGFGAWGLVGAIGLDGTLGAVIAAIVGMLLAVAVFAGLTASMRALGWMR